MYRLDKDTHTYWHGEDKINISVTQLLRKHGISPNYGAVDSEMLEAASRKGTLVHEEIEMYIKYGTIGFTEEFGQYLEAIQGYEPMLSEHTVGSLTYSIAGTIDLVANKGDVLADFKTTYSMHKESVAWQLSLLAYLGGYTPKKLLAFHLGKKTKAGWSIVEVEKIDEREIIKLLAC